jgi:eukaryotic-like serine/threonine-protein kinase
MYQVESCSVCGRSLPGDAPLGLCPACLFTAALASESSASELDAPAHSPHLHATALYLGASGPSPGRVELPTTVGPPSDDFAPPADGGLADTRPTDGPFRTLGWTSLARPNAFPDVPGYEILDWLGQGGMGVVYKALQIRAKRLVALKMIRGDAPLQAAQLERFCFEVQAAARLKHPNVVQIYDVGEAGGRPYFSLELLEGGTLRERLADAPMAPRPAATLLIGLATAIDAAHRAGIVHRDLKPSNVLFDDKGTAKVADFGLAKQLESDDGPSLSGQVMGTPSYMAPEQARGDRRAVGPAADIYALGAILYEMLTGRPPFRSATFADTIHLVKTQEPVAPSRLQPRVPRDLETICLKCLEKAPGRRYASARELAEDLERFLGDESILARPSPAWERAWKWSRRRPTTAALLAVGLAAAIALGAGLEWTASIKRADEARLERLDGALGQEAAAGLGKSSVLKGRGDLDEARVILITLRTQLQDRPRLAPFFQLVAGGLADVEQRLAARSAKEEALARFDRDFARFCTLRDVALFHDAGADAFWRDPTSGDVVRGPSRVLKTRAAARLALEVFGWTSDDLHALATLPDSLPAAGRDEIRSDCYLLLMVLSEAVASPLPGGDPRGQARQALRLLDGASMLHPPTAAYLLRRASCLDRLEDAAAARLERERARSLPPAAADDHLLLGQECSRRGEWEDALSHFRTALRERPELFLTHYLFATAALNAAPPRAAEACSELTHCLTRKENRSYAWLYQLRGLAYGQMGAALTALATSRGPTEPAPAPSAEAEARYEDAEADFSKALDLGLDQDFRYTLLMNRGTMRFQRRRFRAAADDFEQAVAIDSNRFNGFASLAQALRQLGRREEAVERFGEAIALSPALAALYRGRALARIDGDSPSPADARAAISDLRESARREAAGSRAAAADHARAARLWLRLDRTSEGLEAAERAAEAALAIAPDLGDAHLVRIAAQLDQKRYDRVIESCEAALGKVPPSATLHFYRGLGRSGRRDFAAAIDDYTRALTLKPDWEEAHGHRGWAYLFADATELALRDFEKVIALKPGSPEGYAGRGSARVRKSALREGVADAEESLSRSRSSRRMLYVAAQTYARASALAALEAVRRGRSASRDSLAFEARAIDLLGQAIERTPADERPEFWREVVARDDAMRPLLRNPQVVKRLKPVVLSAR